MTAEGKFNPMSSNVKVYGALVNAESCSYDSTRNLILAVNRGGGAEGGAERRLRLADQP